MEGLAAALGDFTAVQRPEVATFLGPVDSLVTPMDQRPFNGLGALKEEYTIRLVSGATLVYVESAQTHSNSSVGARWGRAVETGIVGHHPSSL